MNNYDGSDLDAHVYLTNENVDITTEEILHAIGQLTLVNLVVKISY